MNRRPSVTIREQGTAFGQVIFSLDNIAMEPNETATLRLSITSPDAAKGIFIKSDLSLVIIDVDSVWKSINL